MEVADERGVPIAPSPAPPAHPRTPRVTRCTIILNQKAGSVVEASRAAVEASCAHAGLDARIVAVPGPEIAAAAAQAAAAGDTLVAAGGDGTVSTVAAVAVKTGAAFGVIPLGTLNHFARDAGIPLDVDAAVAALAEGHLVPLDAGELNGRTFVNNVSIGFYARVVRERQLEQQRGHRKWIAFAIGLARAWTRYHQITVRMTVDGKALVRRTPFIFVGNGDYIDEGPKLGRRQSLTSGRLWISLAPECSRAEMLILVVRAIAGRLTPDIKLEQYPAAEVTIEPRARRDGVAMDGELVAVTPPFTCAIRAGVLRTLLPRA
jgi:diacylglycerol kinase family enzyme